MAKQAKKRSKPDFNYRRFLTLVILFSGVAALMLFNRKDQPAETAHADFPLYDLLIVGSAAKGSLILNDISIARYKLGDEKRDASIALTPWLKNGVNLLTVTTSVLKSGVSPKVSFTLKTTQQDGTIKNVPLFTLTQPASKRTTIKAQNLPAWTWLNGKATFHNEDELKEAISALHKAYNDKKLDVIAAVEDPLFKDMVRLTGREKLSERHYRKEIIMKGRVEPLASYRIVPFDNGRIMRATGPDGEAPIRIYFNYGNGGKAILTGKYWSKINGQWRVVR